MPTGQKAKSMTHSQLVRAAFNHTKAIAPDYIAKTLAQRAALTPDGQPNPAAAGSLYPQMTAAQIETALMAEHLEWTEVTGHPAIAPGTRVFAANLPGVMGMQALTDLPPETEVHLVAPDKGGNLFPQVELGTTLVPTTTTHAILGMKDPANPFFVTVYPGDLVARSELSPEMLPESQRHITAAKALNLGFTHAKLVAK